MANHFDLLIDSYLDNKIGVDADFLPQSLADGLLRHLLTLQDEGKLMPAGIGNDQVKDTTQQVRGDKIYWLDKEHPNESEQEFLALVEKLIGELNSTCYAGINDYEFHYAIYEAGNYYKRHRDQFKNNASRKYSLVSYLNKDWVEADGGQLIVYNNHDVQQILPEGNKAVFFKSDEMEHEVAVAGRSRMSITGWLKRV